MESISAKTEVPAEVFTVGEQRNSETHIADALWRCLLQRQRIQPSLWTAKAAAVAGDAGHCAFGRWSPGWMH